MTNASPPLQGDPKKAEAVERFKAEQMGQASPENADARADNPLSDPKNMAAQGNA